MIDLPSIPEIKTVEPKTDFVEKVWPDGTVVHIDPDLIDDSWPAPVELPPETIVAAHPYPDGKNVLLVTDKGVKIFHEIGGRIDKRAEKGYQEFLKTHA